MIKSKSCKSFDDLFFSCYLGQNAKIVIAKKMIPPMTLLLTSSFALPCFCPKDALPPKEMNPAERHCKMADVVLCLGTR